jgi:hypothetical protein
MALACNIDARGKAVRLRIALVLLVLGLAALGWALGSGGSPQWTAAVVLLTAGGFTLFEARAGWCALRAMGVKTPL